MTRRRGALLAWCGLLAASWAWVALTPAIDAEPLPPGMDRVAVEVPRSGEGGTPDPITIAHRRFGEPADEAILLLHGSPGSLQDFDALATRLGPERFVVVPDMLGFGRSSRDVSDHSFAAQAEALARLLDALAVDRVHVVGFSWGGGVAIELAARFPDRVASVVMASAIGVQELELLGRHELNRLVHAFQHALVVAVDWLFPHFGALDRSPFGRGYTRSFLDSDQRPLRGALRDWNGPMLVIHGTKDWLVPPAAATEHHRLVPQSRIVWIEGGHLVLWVAPESVANALRAWLQESDAGSLPRRADATPERVAASARAFDRSKAGPQDGLGWIVFFLLVFLASMISEDLTCAGVGLLVATSQIGFVAGVAACVFALVVGDLVLYGCGRLLGPPVLRRFGRSPDELGRVGARLRSSGGMVVLLGRFVPGARLPTYVAAGVLGHPVGRFALWLVVAALLWAPFLVGVTALGGIALSMEGREAGGAWRTGLALVVSIAVAARFLPRLLTWHGRRLLAAKGRRLLRWEFWPIWAIYGPLVPSFLVMAIRHRSLRAPTLVNPPIPGGGLAGESKAAIGRLLARVPAHDIATLVLEPASEVETTGGGEMGQAARLAAVDAFAGRPDVGWPVVIKPDVGERGRGVAICADRDEVARRLAGDPARTLVQAYVPGEEFGLFHLRRPGAERGILFSIARKAPRFVVGNGRDDLERLLLSDPVCLPMAETLLALNAGRLGEVPAAGERVRVTRLGTHSLGCRFLVGEDLRTADLETAVDRLSRSLGLDFGRYDVRAPDEAALRRGEFRVVEFNGLTGEAAHMYDPRYGLFAGLAILRAQWAHAFAIGAAHRAHGREPLSWAELAHLVRSSRA